MSKTGSKVTSKTTAKASSATSKSASKETPDEASKTKTTKNRFTYTVIGLALLVGLGSFGVVYAMSKDGGKGSQAFSATCQGECIYLKEDGATPDAVTVATGGFLEFTSADGKRHNLSLSEHGDSAGQDSGSHISGGHNTLDYSSGDFEGDEAWRVQFKTDGTFTFVDKYNPKIRVSVVVYTAGKDYKIE